MNSCIHENIIYICTKGYRYIFRRQAGRNRRMFFFFVHSQCIGIKNVVSTADGRVLGIIQYNILLGIKLTGRESHDLSYRNIRKTFILCVRIKGLFNALCITTTMIIIIIYLSSARYCTIVYTETWSLKRLRIVDV